MVAKNLQVINMEDMDNVPSHTKSASVKDSECISISSRSEDYGSKDSGSITDTQSEPSSTTSSKKLISKPILDGKTYTTILYEIIASVEEHISIKYFQVDTVQPRTRDTRFKIECHLNDKLYGVGEGSSKKAAKQLASKVALDRLLDERPHLREDVGRVRKGFPSKKKLHHRSRRRLLESGGTPNWRRNDQGPYPARRPNCFDPYFEMQERRRLAIEFEAVNRMLANIEKYSGYLGYDDMTPYEKCLFNDFPSYYDSPEFERRLMMEDFERSLYGDMERAMNQPDTFDFMRKMQARASKKDQPSKLNVKAQEFKPTLSAYAREFRPTFMATDV
jgi:hypothetical protein